LCHDRHHDRGRKLRGNKRATARSPTHHIEFNQCYQQHVYRGAYRRRCTRATLRLRMMMALLDNPVPAPPRLRGNKLALRARRQSSFSAANYHHSADWSQIRAMPPFVVINDPLDPVALAPQRPLPDAIPSVLASRAVPKAARIQVSRYIEIAEQSYGTAKIRFKRSKSTLQRGAASEPTTKFSYPAAEIGCFWRPAGAPAFARRNPKSEIRRGALVRTRLRDHTPSRLLITWRAYD
jgi:hypothetical protein